MESRLAELDALLPMGETAIVPEASNRKAEAQMEETGLQTWVSKLLP